MAEVQVPSEEHANPQPPAGWAKRHILRAALPLLLVAVVIVLAVLLAPSKNPGTNSGKPHFVIDNKTKYFVAVADNSGKQLYKLGYHQYGAANFEASSASGELLLSVDAGSSNESYILAKDGKAQALSAADSTALKSSVFQGNSHHMYFLDNDTIAYVACPSGSTCKLMSLNLATGKTQQIADTGAKPIIPQLPTVYPLGLSPDRKTVYLRTLTTSKLGKKLSAIYAVGLGGKVSGSWDVPRDADYTVTLSPNAKQAAYRTGYEPNLKVGTIDLNVNKTHEVKWTGGAILDSQAAFAWSPDSKKVLVVGTDGLLPRANPTTTYDTNLAYLDASTTQLTKVLAVKDSSHHQVSSLAWLDNKTVVYNNNTATDPYAFSDGTNTVYKLALGGQPVALKVPTGVLKQVIFY